jgi:glycosyltransferase involved in cell wall biosynthesis
MSLPLVSIIIPVYNVEHFVERCVRSLLEQTYQNIEFIIVDDASPDSSLIKIKKVVSLFPDRKENVRYILHEKNQGLPTARNSGLSIAKGEYVFHCDGDDWVDHDMIDQMVRDSILHDSDIVYSDWYLTFEKRERYMIQTECETPKECIKAMLEGRMRFNVWNKLVRRALYENNNIRFPDGKAMGEDMTMIKLFCHAQSISYIPKAFYHYLQLNPNAYTKQSSEKKLIEIRENVASVMTYVTNMFGKHYFEREFFYFKLNIKLPFLISLDNKMYDLWRSWYPEANKYIGENPAFSGRTKIIQYAALRKQDWFLKLYNIFIIQFVYGIIYR